MKQKTFKTLSTVGAAAMTAYTVHCILRLIPAVQEMTLRLFPIATVYDDAYFGAWFGVLMTAVILTIIIMIRRGKQDPLMPDKPFIRMTYITAIIAVLCVIVGCHVTNTSVCYTPTFLVPGIVRIPLLLSATAWLWLMTRQDGIGRISKALRVAAIIGIVGLSVPISRMMISAVYYCFNEDVIMYRSWAVASWAQMTIPAFLLAWYSIELWWQTNTKNITMETENIHFRKKILIASLGMLAIAALVFACLMCKIYYDKYYKISYWESWTDYLSEHIVLEHGYKGMEGFEQLKDIRTGEYTTPRLDHVFINIYNSEDSLVVFRTFDRLRGYLNVKTGKIIIPAQYQRAWNFSEGIAAVYKEGLVSFINSSGEPAFPTTFPIRYNLNYDDIAFQFHNGLCIMRAMDYKWGLINTKGEWVLEPVYTTISAPKYGYRIVSDGIHYGLISEEGQVVLPVEYDFIRLSSNPAGFTVAKDGFEKIIDKDLHTIIPFAYDGLYYLPRAEYDDYRDAESETSDYRRYRVGSGNGVIDKNGKVIIPAKYYMVRMIGDDLFDVEVTYDGEHILINSKGQIVG